MAKIVNREEKVSNSFEDLISLPTSESNEETRKATLGHDKDEKKK
ncbi:hypothetical protein [Leuconostoc mesenteroides]|nr:hypothetical protein [Leuconostoc mesenteroides]